ncbi:MAG: TRAM domain-containing protein [Candidatus Levybacteria bacterium]|nr:TRAM domain-containing protein [Candidatus Levybacteria bacterium]
MKDKTKNPSPRFPKNFVSNLAEEVAKTLATRFRRLPNKKNKKQKKKKIESPIFLDTSAIIDGRVFDVANLGLFTGTFVILESILLELKHIADSQDMVKRVRGRKGLDLLEKLKKSRRNKVIVLPDNEDFKNKEVDEKLIDASRNYKGRIITCDYNLEKKAAISGVLPININTLANHLKITAVPGEALHISILHKGKEITQGVGYLDDGTMLVVENASDDLGKTVDVVVSRVIQTTAGRILFAKKI